MPLVISATVGSSEPRPTQLTPVLPATAAAVPSTFESRTVWILGRLRSQRLYDQPSRRSGQARGSSSARLTPVERAAIKRLKELGLWEEP